MANYRPVDVRLWDDRKFLAGSDDARLLWLFLLTCPSLPIPGVVLGGDAALAERLGWTVERLRERFHELSRNGLQVRRETRIVWLPNALKYQPPANPNMVKGWSKKWDDVPEGDLKADLWEALRIACKTWSVLFTKLFAKPFREGSGNGLPNGSGNGSTHKHEHKHDHQHEHYTEKRESASAPPPLSPTLEYPTAHGMGPNGESAIDQPATNQPPAKKPRKKRAAFECTQQERESATRVLGKLGERNGVAYEGCDDHVRVIVERIREGKTEMDLRKVIAFCAEVKRWEGDPEWEHCLNPDTLFGPRNITRYLDPARSWAAREYPNADQPKLEVVK